MGIADMYQESTDKILDDRVARPLPERTESPGGIDAQETIHQAKQFISDYYGAIIILTLIVALTASRKTIRSFAPVDLTLWHKVGLWAIFIIVTTIVTTLLLGPKGGSQSAAGAIFAAYWSIKKSKKDETDKQD